MDQSLTVVAKAFSQALTPLSRVLASSDERLVSYVASLGWNLPSLPQALRDLQSTSDQLVASLAKLEAGLRRVRDGSASEDSLKETGAELLLDLGLFTSAITRLPSGLREQLPADFIAATRIDEQIRARLFNDAISRHLEYEARDIYLIASLLGLVESIRHAADPLRFQPEFEERRLRPDRLLLLASDPATLFRDVYGWGTPTLDGEKLFLALRDLSYVLLAPAFFDYGARSLWRAIDSGLPESVPPARGLRLPFFSGSPLEVTLGVYALPTSRPDELQGLALTLSGLADIKESFAIGPSLTLNLKSQIDLSAGVALAIWPDRAPKILGNISGSPTALVEGANASLNVKFSPPNETARLPLLSFPGLQVDTKAVAIEAGIGMAGKSEVEVYAEAALSKLRLQLGGLGQDSFLSRVLPDSVAVEFDLSVGLSVTRGFYWRGSASPKITIPVNLQIGPVSVDSLDLGLTSVDDKLGLSVSMNAATQLGPVFLRVEGLGAAIGVASHDGNLGPVDVGLAAVAPRGVALAIDAPGVSGGGYLFLDTANGQYAGFLQINIKDTITVTAIGLITTRLPNGAKGFSFVVMITAQDFKPIPLGLGFSLTGIGGLLAINRTCSEEALREGLKNATLDSLLFPKDPIRNAPQIFGSLNAVFPPREGSYFFGPVVQISWGTPPVVRMNLAIILELGNRKRLIILGQLKAILPTEKHDLIRLQMNALGIIDFDQGSIALDAVLYDSRLVGKFPITGSMAMRLNWGSAPMFALSIGGFHPAFKPPANFPVLQRLAISLSNSDNFQLRAETYIAITSNTLQFGAKLELMARAGGFSVEGRLGFDVLIQFDPFFFRAEFYASVQLKRGSMNLFKVKLEGALSGPRPLHVRGKATFEIFWCDFSVGFDKTLVDGEAPPSLPPIAVMALLKAALDDSRNWAGQLAEGARRMVALREPQQVAGRITLHPLGQLSVKQNVVPLDLQISRFGNATPADARLFKVNALSVNGQNRDFARVNDFFSPSQFLELSDDEKLAAPSFEPMMAGVKVGIQGFTFTANEDDILIDDAIKFETIVIDREAKVSRPAPPVTIGPAVLIRMLSFGAAAQSKVRSSGTARYQPTFVKNVLLKKAWTIVSSSDGRPEAAPDHEAGKIGSYAESFQALQKEKQANPRRASKLMLMRVPASKN